MLSSKSIVKARQVTGRNRFVLKERTMLTVEGKAVPAGHPDGVQLLGTAGATITLDVAEAVGLVGDPQEWPRHVGGGVYELSDGSRIRGKDDALEAQEFLDENPDDEDTPPTDDGDDDGDEEETDAESE